MHTCPICDTEHDDMLKSLTGMSDERLREIKVGAKIYLAIYDMAYRQAIYPINDSEIALDLICVHSPNNPQ